MTDPRTPEAKRSEEQLPDDLDQNPGAEPAAVTRQHGSEDAQLLAGAGGAEGDVEHEAAARPAADSADAGASE